MRKLLFALGILALICSPAMAGKNANGAMVVHTNDAYTYSAGTACTTPLGDPGTCEAAITRTDKGTGAVVWLLAAFLPNASPGVTVVYFGINYDDACLDPSAAYKFCGPSGTLEVPDGDWPLTGRGNSVAFGAPVVGDTLFPFYVFKIDDFCGAPGPFFCTTINPTGGYAAFVDDSNPPVIDPCTLFGCVAWYAATGHNNCPEIPPVQGACCFPDGSCQVTTPTGCTGAYQGDGTVCDPNPCPQPEACCFEDGSCRDLLAADCTQAGGTPQGAGILCAGITCPLPPQACCHADGTCTFVPPNQCDGTPWGVGTTCEPNNPCPPPVTAACCVGDVCHELSEADCASQGGTYYPNDHCANFSCPPTPTENTTWGQIKAGYR